MNILDYINRINEIYGKDEPRITAQEPRNMAHGGRIIGKPGGLVEPGVEYYGKTKIAINVAANLAKSKTEAKKYGIPFKEWKKYSKKEKSRTKSLSWYDRNIKPITPHLTDRTIKIDGKSVVLRITRLRQEEANAITEGLKSINKWKKNPTDQNWVDIFRKPSGQASDFSRNVRKYLRGEEIDSVSTKAVFDQIKLKKIIGADAAKIIK